MPLVERALTKSFEPLRRPSVRSPETDWSATWPWVAEPMRTSPEIVFAWMEPPASRSSMSPETEWSYDRPGDTADGRVPGDGVDVRPASDGAEGDVP